MALCPIPMPRRFRCLVRHALSACFCAAWFSLLVAGALVSEVSAQADDDAWTIDVTKQHPPVARENRIIRWCSEDGRKTRFASANIKIEGYKPCGELQTAMACDPAGARLIAPDGTFPHTYRDCSVGPRITIVRTDRPEDDPSSGSAKRESSGGTGLTPEEQRRLERDFTAAQKQQEAQSAREVEQMMKVFVGAFGLGDQVGDERGGRHRPAGRNKRGNPGAGINVQELLKALSQP